MEPLPEPAPSGYREVIIAREDVDKLRPMVVLDGNRVRWCHLDKMVLPNSHRHGCSKPERTPEVLW
jgi:hypothetical protein